MSFSHVKYEVVEHDPDNGYTEHVCYCYLSILPSKMDLIDAICKVDQFASLFDVDRFKLIVPEGYLPSTVKLAWKDDGRVAYTAKPIK